jgi:hypothetical protein
MRLTICAVVLALLLCSATFASVTPCATGQTLAFYVTTYTTAANGCQLDDKIFYGFVDTITAGGGASAAGVGISVTPDPTHLNPGLDFSLSGLSVTSNQSLDIKLGFDVQVLSGGNLMHDASLGIAGAQNSGTGSVTIGENLCVGGTFAVPGSGTNCSTGSSKGFATSILFAFSSWQPRSASHCP